MKKGVTSTNTAESKKRRLILILPNIRSAHNVGSIFRTADAMGVGKIYLCGHTPTPIDKFGRVSGPQREIAKTALGAETYIPYEYSESFIALTNKLKKAGSVLIGLELHQDALKLHNKKDVTMLRKIISHKPARDIVLVLGEEVAGMTQKEIEAMDYLIEIPMFGKKESLNVSVAAGIALYTIKVLMK